MTDGVITSGWVLGALAAASGVAAVVSGAWARRALRRQKTLAADVRSLHADIMRLRAAHLVAEAGSRLERAGRPARFPVEFTSEFGEDAFIWALFDGALEGFFIEVGAFDGRTLSVTYALEAVGWRGLLVEAIPERAKACAARRPGSRVVHAALSRHGSGATATFSIARGVEALSFHETVDAHRSHVRSLGGTVERVEVPLTTLDALLADHTGPIDVASIDVEGAELALLEGFDLARHRPRVLLIEDVTGGEQPALDAFLDRAGYAMAGWIGYNQVRIRAGEDALLERARSMLLPAMLPSLRTR